MKVLDKFLDAMKLSDDDDLEDEEYYDDEDEYYEDDKPKKSKFMKRGYSDDSYGDSNEEDDMPKQSKPHGTPLSKHSSSSAKTVSKVTPMRPSRRSGGQASMEVCVMRPTSVEDSKEIGETLLTNRTVVLNLEGLDMEIAQRIFDFSSGACFALNGNLQKVSKFIFLITPSNVDISGDLTDILNDSFDNTSMRGNY